MWNGFYTIVSICECDTLLEALIILKCNATKCKHEWRCAPRSALTMPPCRTPMLFFLLLVFENLEKKVAAAITTSAIVSSAISLLYLHIINIPMHVICLLEHQPETHTVDAIVLSNSTPIPHPPYAYRVCIRTQLLTTSLRSALMFDGKYTETSDAEARGVSECNSLWTLT